MNGPRIALHGFVLVTLVAWNVVNVSTQQYLWALVTGFLVSFVWWANASMASEARKHPQGGWWYGFGAALGTVAGMWIGR